MLTELIIILALTVAGGIFAGAEIAIVALRKTRLQELMHARGKAVPEYRVVATHGAPHQRSFEVECRIEGMQTKGTGTSRQRAEQEAARAMLDKLEK